MLKDCPGKRGTCQGSQQWRSLASLLNSSTQPGIRICIVTPELPGMMPENCIGTACACMAFALAAGGHHVQLLFAQDEARIQEKSLQGLTAFADRGIKVSFPVMKNDRAYDPSYPPLIMALHVYEWLRRQQDFDLVLFMEWQGNGFYALHAKKCGLRFGKTALAVIICGPSIWRALNNIEPDANPIESCCWHMERQCIAMADAVICNSAYLLDWCQRHGYQLPELSFVQPGLLESPDNMASPDNEPVDELVFFGTMEYRKGLAQFCDALDKLASCGKLPAQITFLGKCAFMGAEHSLVYIGRRCKKWKPAEISLPVTFGLQQPLEYMRGKKRLAVIPYATCDAVFAVYECLLAGIPFLARNGAGIPELVAPADRDKILFSDNPADLAARMAAAIGSEPFRARPGFDPRENAKSWVEGLAALAAKVRVRRVAAETAEQPFISVCLTHYNRPQLLRQAATAFMEQDYRNFEVILADDGSPSREAAECLNPLEPEFKKRGWKILRLENGYLGRARNLAAREAKGDWLLFFDDDNVPRPNMLGICSRAAAACKNGHIALMFDIFDGSAIPEDAKVKERFLPTGGVISYSAITNTLADAASLVSRDAFTRSGGFTQDYGLGYEDFELYLRMALAAVPMHVLPEPLFYYRRNSGLASMLSHTNAAANRTRGLRPFMDALPPQMAELAFMAHGMAETNGFYGQPDRAVTGNETVLTPWGLPQSPAALENMADLLEKEQCHSLSEQIEGILDQLEVENTAYAPAAAQEARLAAKKGDAIALNAMLDKLADGQRRELVFAACMAALRSLPEHDGMLAVRARLVAMLKECCGKSIRAGLAVAMFGHALEDRLFGLCHAFIGAEREYLKKRADVALAMEKKAFVCALHHYCLHGLAEKTDWPQRAMFNQFLTRFPHLLEISKKAHMRLFHYADSQLAAEMLDSLII